MKNYTLLYAEDVPCYAVADITAATPQDAIAAAKAYDFNDCCADLDWANPIHRRIVHIEAPDGSIIAENIALDNWLALCLPGAADATRPPRYTHTFNIFFSVPTPEANAEAIPAAVIRRAV